MKSLERSEANLHDSLAAHRASTRVWPSVGVTF